MHAFELSMGILLIEYKSYIKVFALCFNFPRCDKESNESDKIFCNIFMYKFDIKIQQTKKKKCTNGVVK